MAIRDLWPNEARDFTPWLAENPDPLGEALGMDLVHESTEMAVGQYRADLLFREESTSRLVVVENMFDVTNHDHVGKLITYAAGLEAQYAVLIANEFRAEHRSALNWLNSISSDEFGFFGIVLRAWQICDSPPAPQLLIDVQPDNWVRSVRTERNQGLTPREQLYQRFWGEFLPAFRDAHPGWTRATQPAKVHWMGFRSARPRLLKYSAAFCLNEGRYGLRVEVYLDTGDATTTKETYDDLHDRKRIDIEREVGEELVWTRLDDKKASRISLYFPEEIRVTNMECWPAAREWLIRALGRLRGGFDPVLQEFQD